MSKLADYLSDLFEILILLKFFMSKFDYTVYYNKWRWSWNAFSNLKTFPFIVEDIFDSKLSLISVITSSSSLNLFPASIFLRSGNKKKLLGTRSGKYDGYKRTSKQFIITKNSLQEPDSNRSVCMSPICYNNPI